MISPAARKWFGAIVAALTLTLVTNVSPASAASKSTSSTSTITPERHDTGWDIP